MRIAASSQAPRNKIHEDCKPQQKQGNGRKYERNTGQQPAMSKKFPS